MAPRVDFKPEVKAYGLRLCPGDMKCEHFKRDSDGKMVFLDFDVASFLPVSFFRSALDHRRTWDNFSLNLRQRIEFLGSTYSDAVTSAGYALVLYGKNEAGEHIVILSYLSV